MKCLMFLARALLESQSKNAEMTPVHVFSLPPALPNSRGAYYYGREVALSFLKRPTPYSNALLQRTQNEYARVDIKGLSLRWES